MSFVNQESVFQQGLEGYHGTIDTQLLSTKPNNNYGAKDVLSVDGEPESVVLLAFQDIFGEAVGQIPLGAEITSATLSLYVTNGGHGASVHRLLESWGESDTWNSLENGIQTNDEQAVAQAELVTGWIDVGLIELDVTSSVQAWADGNPNFGWAFLSLGTNGWYFHSAENLIAPKLVVQYSTSGGTGSHQDSQPNGPPPDDLQAKEEVQILSSESHQQQTVSFQQGVDGYEGTLDTQLAEAKPSKSYASATTLKVDGDDPSNSGFDLQVLLRFSDLFGSGPGQIPYGATIVSATLALQTTGRGDGAALHRMLAGWSDSDTWNSMVNGVQADGVEAVQSADLVTGKQKTGVSTFDVTNSIQAWSDGAPNLGWAFLAQGSDGWKFDSSEGKIAPKLTITYHVSGEGEPPPNRPPVAQDDAAMSSGAAITINVLANDIDPDGDPLTVTSITSPANGTAHINANNTITYSPNSGFAGVEVFQYTVSDGRGGTAAASVTVTVTSTTLAASYMATTLSSNDERNMEHTNASKSFYHDGSWWAVLPNDKNWYVHSFDALPEVGTLGGWSITSGALAGSKMRADIAWDPVNEKLYVLQFRLISDPVLYKLGYKSATESWQVEATVKVAGSGGVLSGAHWTGNDEITIGIDQFGNPLLAVMGPSPAGGQQGLHLAYPTSSHLTSWSQINLDPSTTALDKSNGSAKGDFVMFSQGGVMKIGIVYSADAATDAWKIVWRDASPNPGVYGNDWSSQVITTKVAIDDHISVVSDGTTIYAVVKDNKDSIWMLKGAPGNWHDPIKVHNGTGDTPKFNPSRPTVVLDESNGMLYVFYQETVSKPRGDIYVKTASTTNTVFDPKDPGQKILTNGAASPNMIDPQGPVHNVGSQADYFFLFAKDADAPHVWYNDILLTTDYLLA